MDILLAMSMRASVHFFSHQEPYLSMAITGSIVNIFFTELVYAGRGTIDMKHIRQDFC